MAALDALGTSGQIAPAASDEEDQRTRFMQAAGGGIVTAELASYYLAARAAGTITANPDSLIYLSCQCIGSRLRLGEMPFAIGLVPAVTINAPSLVRPGDTVTLSASAGGGGSIGPLSQEWTQISGPSVTLANSDTLSASFTAPDDTGDLVFEVAITEAASPINFTGTRRVAVTLAASTFVLSGPGEVMEGATAEYIVTYNGATLPIGGATLDYAVTGGGTGMAAAADFMGGNFPNGDNAIVFPGGAVDGAVQTFSVSLFDDEVSEAAERFTVTISDLQTAAPSAAIVAASARVDTIISENDRPVTLGITGPGSALTEGAAADFTISFAEPIITTADVTVTWTIVPGTATATADADFSVRSGTATIFAGERSVTISITADADSRNEGIENFLVTLSDPAGGGPTVRPTLAAIPIAGGSIAASDDAVIIIDNRNRDTDPDAIGRQVPEGGTALYTFSLQDSSSRNPVLAGAPLEINYGISGDVAASDYRDAGGGRVVIMAGSSSAEFSIVLRADSETPEADERIRVTPASITPGAGAGAVELVLIQSGIHAGTPAFADVRIRDVAFPRHFSVVGSAASIAEGDTVTFTVTLDMQLPSGERSTVDWAISGNAEPDDYQVSGSDTDGTFSFAPLLSPVDPDPDDTPCCIANLRVLAIDDMVSEGDEDLTITLSNAAGGGGTGTGIEIATATVTIRANDQPVTLGITGPGSALTEGAAADFTISFSETTVTTDAIGVRWTITPGTPLENATSDADFSVLTGLAIILRGERSTVVPITAREDGLAEGMENFVVTLSDAVRGGSNVSLALADPPYVAASIAASVAGPRSFSVTVDETSRNEGQMATFTVELSGDPPTEDATVNWAIAGVESGDYSTTAGSMLTFTPANWQTAQEVTVLIADDNLNEAAETLVFTLSDTDGGGPGGTGIATASAQTTIAESDPVTYSIAADADADTVVEGADGETATLSFTVSLSGASAGAVTIPFTLGGDATGGVAPGIGIDYITPNPATVTIPSGDLSAEIAITVRGDVLNEADETIEVTLSAETDGVFSKEATAGAVTRTATVALQSGIGTITDDDAVTYSIADAASVVEGADGAMTTMSFTVTLSGASAGAVTIPFTLGGDATGGVAPGIGIDYITPNPATVTIPSGDLSAEIAITVRGDTLNEADETIEVTLSAETDGAFSKESAVGTVTRTTTVASQRGIGTITDDDAVTYSISDAGTVEEGADGAMTTMSFTVTLSGASAGAVTIPFILGGTATVGTDYTEPMPATVTIAAGSTSAVIAITVRGDAVNEADETIEVTLAAETDGGFSKESGVGAVTRTATESSQRGVGTITDDDAVTYSISDAASVVEGAAGAMTTMSFTVSLSAALVGDVTIPFTLGGTATGGGTDYVTPNPATVTISAGSTGEVIAITVRGDAVNEADETIEVTLAAETDGGFSKESGVGTVTRTATESSQRGVGTITDDDAVTYSIADAGTVEEGAAGAMTTMSFTVSLSGASAGAVTIPFILGGTATVGTDYTEPMPATVTIAAGSTSAVIAITVRGDAVNEADETIEVTLAAETDGGFSKESGVGVVTRTATESSQRGVGTITDDDAVTYSIADAASVVEGAAGAMTTMSFTVSLSAALVGDVTIPFTLGGTATGGGTDYVTPNPATVTISAGSTGEVIAITVRGDAVNEADETIEVTLSAETDGGFSKESGVGAVTRTATESSQRGIGTITDDDAVTYSISDAGTVEEGAAGETATLSFMVTLSGASAGAVTIPFTLGGTATGGVAPGIGIDYITPNPATVTIPSGDIRAEIAITVRGDTLNEADETIEVTLSAETAGGFSKESGVGAVTRTATESSQRGVGTITDDDAVTYSISDAGTVEEGAAGETATLSFTVTLSGASAGAVTIPFTLGGTATGGAAPGIGIDYITPNPATVTIPSGDIRAEIAITVRGDTLNEADETIEVTLSAETAGGFSKESGVGAVTRTATESSQRGVGTITDDDAVTYSIADAASVVEGADGAMTTMSFTVTLSGASAGAVTIPFTLGGTATGGAAPGIGIDYITPNPATVTIPSGVLRAEIAITVRGDTLNEADETIEVTLSAETAGGFSKESGVGAVTRTATESSQRGVGTITDDDAVTYSISDAGTVEEGAAGETATLSFTVTLSGASAGAVTIPFTLGGTATGGAAPGIGIDYITPNPATVTIPSGVLRAEIAITVRGDTLNEADETIEVTLSAETAGGFSKESGVGAVTRTATESSQRGVGTITDDDAVTYSIADAASVVEGADGAMTTMSFTVTLSGASAGAVTIPFTLGGTATGGVAPGIGIDYITPNPATVTIPSGDLRAEIAITVRGDTLNEADETIEVTLSAETAGGFSKESGVGAVTRTATESSQRGVGTITDDDAVTYSISDAGTVEEGAAGETATLSFTVTLSGASAGAVTIPFTLGGNATGGAAPGIGIDYITPNPATVTIPSGDLRAEIAITVRGDTLNEADETIEVTLSAETAGGFSKESGVGAVTRTATESSQRGVGTITDDDAVTYSISDAGTVEEGAAGETATLSFTVTLSGASAGAVTIPFALGGTATGGTDYETPSPLTVTVPASMTATDLEIVVNGDDLNEAAEDIIVTLGGAATVGAGGGEVTLSTTSGDETGTGTITDDDAIMASIAPSTLTIDEAASATLTVTLDHESAADVTLSYTVAAAAVSPGTSVPMFTHDGGSGASGSLTIRKGATMGVILLTSTPDPAASTGTGTLTVALGTVSVGSGGGTVSASGSAAVTVNFLAFDRSFAVAVDDVNTAEGATATFTVTLSGAAPVSGTPATVTWTLSGVETSDYSAPPTETGTLIFANANWNTAQSVSVAIAEDTLNEGAETLTLTLSGAAGGGGNGAGITTASASTTIAVSDPITYSIATADQTRAEGDGTTTAVFTVELSGAAAGSAWDSITVPFSAAASSTASVTGDYTLSASPLTFTGTDLSEDITVTIAADDLNEAAETLNLELGATAGNAGSGGGAIAAGTDTEATLTITDDDAIAVSIARTGTGEVSEGDDVEFTITLNGASGGSAGPVMVPWTAMVASQANSGAANTDTQPDLSASGGTVSNNGVTLNGTLTIPANTASETLTITAANDSLAEGDESFEVSISAPSGGAGSGTVGLGAPASVTVGIDENAAAAHVVTVSEPGTAVTEGATAVFTLDLPAVTGANARTTALTVNYSLGGSAVSGSDYTHTASSVTFAAASASETVSILITDDMLNEGEEMLTLTLGSVDNATSFPGGAAADGSASIAISASDPVTYSIADATPDPLPEGAPGNTATLSFGVTLSGASAGAVTIPFALGGTATGGTDYETPSPLTVTVPASMTATDLEIVVNGDDLNEAAEDIIVTLGGAATVGAGGGEVTLSATSGDETGIGTITDDDAIMASIAPSTLTIDEAASATLTVTLDHESAADVTLSYTVAAAAVSPGTSVPMFTHDGGSGASGSLTIREGATMGVILLTSTPDPAASTGTGTLTVALGTVSVGSGGGTVSASGSAAVTVNFLAFDRSFAVAVDDVNTAEGATATFTVTLSGAAPVSGTPAAVTWTLSGVETSDYSAPPTETGTLIFANANWNTAQSVNVAIAEDTLNEGAETLTLTLSGAAGGGGNGAGITTASASTTIAVSDPITYSIATADQTRAEGDGTTTAVFTVELSGAAAGSAWDSITVPFSAAASSTAVVTGDYTLSASPLTFTGTDLSEDITVTIAADDLNEAAETLNLELGATAGTAGSGGGAIAVGTDAEATLTITDDDAIAVSIARTGSGEVSEGDDVEFTITLNGASGGSAGPVMVPWTAMVASQANSGAANTDTQPDLSASGGTVSNNGVTLNGTLTIPANTASETLTITAANDSLAEGDESFEVSIGAPSGGAGSGTVGLGAPASVTVGIDENAAAAHMVTVSEPGAAVAEGATAVFTLDLPAVTGANARTTALTVNYSLGGSAVSGSDYTHTASSVTFAAASASETVSILITDDMLNEGEEMLTLTLGSVDNATSFPGGAAADGSASIAISASDPVTYSIADATPDPLPEGAPGNTATLSFGVTLSGASAGAVTIPFALGGTATGGTDYETPSPLTVTIPASMTATDLEIVVNGDDVNEAAEDIIVTLGGAATVGAGGGTAMRAANMADYMGTGTIEDDDAITVTVAVGGAVSEGDSVTFQVTLSGGTHTEEVAVPWELGGTADASDTDADSNDYSTGASSPIRIAAGTALGTVVVAVREDGIAEGEEGFSFTVGTVTGGGGGEFVVVGSQQTVVIGASDADARTVALSGPATVAEGETATYSVSVTGDRPTEDIAVTWSVTANTALAADFLGGAFPVGATLTFTQDNYMDAQTFTVGTEQDALNEASERYSVALSVSGGGAGDTLGNGAMQETAIADDDAIEAAVMAPATAMEGSFANFAVTLTGGTSTAPVVITYTVAGAAVADSDYRDPGSGNLEIPAGDTSSTIQLEVLSDNVVEDMAETLVVTLDTINTAGAASIVTAGATTSIAPTRMAGRTVTISGPNRVSEGESVNCIVTIVPEAGAVEPMADIIVAWVVRADSADASDFGGALPGGSLTFPRATYRQSQVITAMPVDADETGEPDETFTVHLTGVTGDAVTTLGMPRFLTIAITEPRAAVDRTGRLSLVSAVLGRRVAALSVPAIASRLDAGRGPEGAGLALNLGGRQVLSPAAGGAAGPAPGGYAAIGLPNQNLAARALAPKGAASGAVRGAARDAGVGNDGAGEASAAAAALPAAGGQGEQLPLLGLASLDVGALAELAASQLEGLDSLSPSAESRTLQQLLGNSGFSATSDRGGGRTLSVWGRGSYTSLDGEPEEGGTRYDYEGDGYALLLGLDGRYGDYLAGLAVGYTVADLELRAEGAAAGDRSDYESDIVMVYPYASWQPSDRLSIWLLAGYGAGELEIEERQGGAVGKASSDTDLWLGVAGLSWRQFMAGGLDVLLRLSGTALHSETDGGIMRFGGGADAPYGATEVDAQQLQTEVELGRAFDFREGGRIRPYLTMGLSYEFDDGARDAAIAEFGAGFKLYWPRLGLETEWEGQARLASEGERDYREYTGTGALRYDLGADRRGLQFALRPEFGLARGAADGALGTAVNAAPLDGGAFGGGPSLAPRVREGGLGLRSELSYGIGDVRPLPGLPGLLTLYGESGFSSGERSYAGGLRFDAGRFQLDAGLRRESGNGVSDSTFLLESVFRF